MLPTEVCVWSLHAMPQVDDSYVSVATIAGGSLSAMANVQTAPRMSAGVFSRGLNFYNGAGQYEGLNAMSQPDTDVQLFAGDTGLVGRTYAVRSYGVSHGFVGWRREAEAWPEAACGSYNDLFQLANPAMPSVRLHTTTYLPVW